MQTQTLPVPPPTIYLHWGVKVSPPHLRYPPAKKSKERAFSSWLNKSSSAGCMDLKTPSKMKEEGITQASPAQLETKQRCFPSEELHEQKLTLDTQLAKSAKQDAERSPLCQRFTQLCSTCIRCSWVPDLCPEDFARDWRVQVCSRSKAAKCHKARLAAASVPTTP